MIGMKEQCFGVEIEMTGITREEAARALVSTRSVRAKMDICGSKNIPKKESVIRWRWSPPS